MKNLENLEEIHNNFYQDLQRLLLSKKLQHPPVHPSFVRDSIHRKWPSNLHTYMAEILTRKGKLPWCVNHDSTPMPERLVTRLGMRSTCTPNRLENYWPTNRPTILTFASLSEEKKKRKKKNRIKVEGRGKRRIRSIRKIDRTIEGGEIDIKGDEVEIWLGHGSMWRVSKDSKASTCFPRSLPTNPERPLKELQRVRGWAGLFSHVAREKKDHYGVTGRRGGWLVFTRLSN